MPSTSRALQNKNNNQKKTGGRGRKKQEVRLSRQSSISTKEARKKLIFQAHTYSLSQVGIQGGSFKETNARRKCSKMTCKVTVPTHVELEREIDRRDTYRKEKELVRS